MKPRHIISLVIAAILVLSVGIFFFRMRSTNNLPTDQQTRQTVPLPKEVTIKIDKNGFSPKEVTIKVGSAIRWKNVSGDKQTVNSDNYPSNQLHQELNFGIFNNNSSVIHTFTKPGTYGYHNQFHHEQEGKVIVTK